MNVRFSHGLLTLLIVAAPSVFAQEFRLPEEPRAAASTGATTAANGDPIIRGCRVDLIEAVNLPAVDPGVLLHLGVREGDQVESEQIIARVDDREARQQFLRAASAYNAAAKRANNGVPEEFAVAQLGVAEATLEELLDTNNRLEGAVPEADVRQARAEVKSGQLRIKNAKQDRLLALSEAKTAEIEVQTARMLIDRRVVRAPFAGEVVEVYRQQQEWVSPGDPILRLIRLDTLYVEGLVSVDAYSFAEIKGCEVTVDVPTTRGRVVQATGRVVWIDPILMRSVDGQIAKVRAEIANRQEKGAWLIHPKREATMTIHLGTGGVAAARK